jgi:hypothetical protein
LCEHGQGRSFFLVGPSLDIAAYECMDRQKMRRNLNSSQALTYIRAAIDQGFFEVVKTAIFSKSIDRRLLENAPLNFAYT